MAIYEQPGMNDTSGIFEMFRYVNTVSSGNFFAVMLLVIWVIVFMGTKHFSSSRAFAAASFVSAGMAIPLAILNLLAPRYMYATFALVAVGVLWLKLET